MKKLPKIFHEDLSNKITNNKKVYNSLDESLVIDNKDLKKETKVDNKNEHLTVKDKIKELIKENDYIFNHEVTLIFDDHEEICHIAGIVNNHIITMDNEIYKIDSLKDIKY